MKKYKISEEFTNIRLDKVVAALDEDLSRAMIQKLLEQEKIFVNGKVQKPSYKTKPGDIIEVEEVIPKEVIDNSKADTDEVRQLIM